jgi:hypothetical protein
MGTDFKPDRPRIGADCHGLADEAKYRDISASALRAFGRDNVHCVGLWSWEALRFLE